MTQSLIFDENHLRLALDVTPDGDVRLLHFGLATAQPASPIDSAAQRWFRLIEIQAAGENQDDHHGSKYTGTSPARLLRYVAHRDHRTAAGRKIEIEQAHDGLKATSHFQFYEGIPIARCWTELESRGETPIPLEFVSSFCLAGLDKEGDQTRNQKCRLYVPHNTWYGEAQWRKYRLPELGLSEVRPGFTTKRISIGNTGTWSCDGYLPMGLFENLQSQSTLFWQIEHNGSWQWEIGEIANYLYLNLSGPAFNENHWMKNLRPGERFISPTAAVGAVNGGFDEAIQALTRYRRLLQRPSPDLQSLPIVFNDYMNCLMADPTTDKLLPLIDAAAEIGCEYFCVDAGWYADGFWWDEVGQWQPSHKRFPRGLSEVMDHIRRRGMIPGLWLEIEVMGIRCPLADNLPNDWFFQRHGRRIIDHGRYQLDFRNPAVRAHADAIVDRLVREFDIGYLKMDYNINAGPGTDHQSDSLGDGLLEHNRAYLSWLDKVFERYPRLIIENCASGGLKADYATLSHHSIHSTTDQTDYRKNAVVLASIFSAVTPEQAAAWSYPLQDATREEIIFNTVNTLLMRVQQSGRIDQLPPEHLALVKQGLDYYRTIRADLPRGLPFWPTGLPSFESPHLSVGLDCPGKSYVALWQLRDDPDGIALSLPQFQDQPLDVRCNYPAGESIRAEWNPAASRLRVFLGQPIRARLLELRIKP
jgi:alpha-galactosidase